jgi:hypothetical protein
MLPASVSKARSDVAELMPATGKASVTPAMSKKADDDVLDVDLSEVDLSDLDSIE